MTCRATAKGSVVSSLFELMMFLVFIILAGLNVDGATGGLGFIHLKALLSIVVASVLFAPLGAKVTHSVDSKILKKGFAIFLACLGLMVIFYQ